jgi:hypothetical protein
VNNEADAIEIAKGYKRPIIISGQRLCFHSMETQTILSKMPLESAPVEQPEPEQADASPAKTETNSAPDQKALDAEPNRSKGFAVKQNDEDRWITDEGIWGPFSSRLIYEDEDVVKEVAERLSNATVIPV